MPTINWRPVVDAAVASRRLDCGHTLPRRSDSIVWLRTERVGGAVEVTSLCYDCADTSPTSRDYTFTPGRHERPSRTRTEYL